MRRPSSFLTWIKFQSCIALFAPFGFGYRRCPGEQLTINVFEDFLRKVWRDKIVFRKLNLPNPGQVPVGPNAVVADDIRFTR